MGDQANISEEQSKCSRYSVKIKMGYSLIILMCCAAAYVIAVPAAEMAAPYDHFEGGSYGGGAGSSCTVDGRTFGTCEEERLRSRTALKFLCCGKYGLGSAEKGTK